MSCRWWSICWRITATAHFASARITSGPGKTTAFCGRASPARSGSVLAERYFAVGETDFHQAIDAIIEARPSFVFLTLIGTSAYQFLRDFRAACRARGIDQAREMPVASCSLSEPELGAIGDEAVDGHLSSSVYFCSIQSPANLRFLSAYEARFPDGPTASADAEASYNAVWLLARSAAAAGNRRSACHQGRSRPPASRGAPGQGLDRRTDVPRLPDAADRTFQPEREVRPDQRGEGAGSARPLSRAQFREVRSRRRAFAEAGVMTEPRLLQNFSGGRAIVVTDRASSLDTLMTTLNRLGVGTDAADILGVRRRRSIVATLQPDRDIIFIDGDIQRSDGASAQSDRPASARARSSDCSA